MPKAIELEEAQPIPEEVAACLRYDVPDSAACDALPADLRISQGELAKVIAAQIERLPSNERLVIKGIYWEGKNTTEIAKETGRSRSRISQIEAKALRRLRHPNYSVPIRIAAGWKDEETPTERAKREAAEKASSEQARQRMREERQAREAQERQERAAAKKQRAKEREKFLITIPEKAPPKLVRLQRIIDTLSAEEEQAIKDYLRLCRFKKCGRKANQYGYCQLHTQAVLGRYFLDEEPGHGFTFLDMLSSLLS